MHRSLSKCVLLVMLLVVGAAPLAAAESPLGRRTTDRQADLIDALLVEGLVDQAEAIARRNLQSAAPGSEAYAKGAIRLSSVFIARARAHGVDAVEDWEAAREIVQSALSGYETMPAAPWLRLQGLVVDLARHELAVLRSMGNPSDIGLRDQTATDLRATILGLRELDDQLAEMIPLAGSGRAPEAASQEDLLRLQQSVRRRMVEALLMQHDLFPADSDDALAAATEAENAASQLLESSPPVGPDRQLAVRMLARAYRQSQKQREAAQLLEAWMRQHVSDPATVAERVLLEIALENHQAAAELLERYYGDEPAEAPRSLEMDLARLEFLVLRSDTEYQAARDEIAAWVEAIGQRGGAYARRRAEIVMLGSLGASPSTGNVTLLEAQAGQLLRRGGEADMVEAAALLQRAAGLAEQAGDAAKVFQLRAQAGAALSRGGDPRAASDAFANAAAAHPDEPRAAAVHFEAARLLAGVLAERAGADRSATLQRLEQLLGDQMRLWPGTAESAAAREWLLNIFQAAGRFEDAAAVALVVAADSPEWAEALPMAADLWRQALARHPVGDARAQVALRAVDALGSIAGMQSATPVASELVPTNTAQDTTVAASTPAASLQPRSPSEAQYRLEAAGHANLIASLGLERDRLRERWIAAGGDGDPAATDPGQLALDLRRVRVDWVDPDGVALSTSSLKGQGTVVDLALERLHADALAHPPNRPLLARAMMRIAQGSDSPATPTREALIAEALAWSGRWQEAEQRLTTLARSAPAGAEYLRRGALLLTGLEDAAARARGVELWNRLAAGVPKGSDAWHEAKLGAAEALRQNGDTDAASKLARYVLLTQPPDDPALRQRYEQLAAPGE